MSVYEIIKYFYNKIITKRKKSASWFKSMGKKSQWTSYNKSTSRHLVDAWSVGMGKGMQSLIIELVCT